MHTSQRKMNPISHGTACGLLAAMIPKLDWRHNGQGCLQAYIREGDTDELRVHLWHRSLRAPGIHLAGLCHDHRFNMRSHVLVGQIGHVETHFTPDKRGQWVMCEVTHAKKVMQQTGNTFHADPVLLPGRFTSRQESFLFVEGGVYYFDKRVFHETFLGDDLCVTLVRKSQQEEDPPARLAWRDSEKLIASFENPLPPPAWGPVLDAAEAELHIRWRKE